MEQRKVGEIFYEIMHELGALKGELELLTAQRDALLAACRCARRCIPDYLANGWRPEMEDCKREMLAAIALCEKQ